VHRVLGSNFSLCRVEAATVTNYGNVRTTSNFISGGFNEHAR
jgi:hypothetical protein